METSFRLEVVTPESIVYDGSVTALTLPASDGLMGVLPNHAPIVAALDLGQVTVRDEAGKEVGMMVSEGFFEMADNHARILADVGEAADRIDVDRARRAEERARGRLAKRGSSDGDGLDFVRAEKALSRAVWRLKIAGR